MLTYLQAIALGLLQGVTELSPISSLGHSVIIPELLGWQVDQASPQFVSFLVAVHLATALVLLGFFWRDWAAIVLGILRSLRKREIGDDAHARLGWLLVVGTIPAGILGLLLQTKLELLFGAAAIVAFVLILNGLMLGAAEILRRKRPGGDSGDRALASLSYPQALWIGLAQSLALVPGFSRTGAAMTGGLLSGLSHESAARFSFLLSTPIILAASVLKVPSIFAQGGALLQTSLAGALAAAIASYVSVRFLLNYFRTKTLTPFAVYCVAAGFVSLAILLVI